MEKDRKGHKYLFLQAKLSCMWTRYEVNFVPERNLFWNYVKVGVLIPGKRYPKDRLLDFWGEGGLGQITFFFFFSLGINHIFLFLGVDEAGGGGWGGDRKWVRMLVSYLLGVKISDLVPFTMPQTLVDYQRPSWYVLGCFSPGAHLLFSLNNIPKVSITRTILMN